MPLVPQQAVITLIGTTVFDAELKLNAQLESFPQVRIISVSLATGTLSEIHLMAIIETV